MTSAEKFSGIWPALLTPFDKQGRVNLPVLRRLIELNIEKGVSGFYATGSTSEVFLLTREERMQIAEETVNTAQGRVKVIVHVGSLATEEAKLLAKHAESIGADAISSVPPFYYGFSFDEISCYYHDIADACGLPIIIYNFPANSGVKLTMSNIVSFLNDPRFIGVKHTSSDFFLMEQIKRKYPQDVLFNGYDEMFLSGLVAGADGGIGSTYNFMAEKFIRIHKLFQAGDLKSAQVEQQRANRIIEVLVKVGVMPGEKAILEYLGLPFGNCRKPFRELTSEEKTQIVQVYKDNC